YTDSGSVKQTITARVTDDGTGKNLYTLYVPEETTSLNITAETKELLANVHIADTKTDSEYTINKYTWSNYSTSNDQTNIYVRATNDTTEEEYVLKVVPLNFKPAVTMYAADIYGTEYDVAANNRTDATQPPNPDTSTSNNFNIRVYPGDSTQVRVDKENFYISYGYLPKTAENYTQNAKLYSDNADDIVWSDWYNGTTYDASQSTDQKYPFADLVTGDNAVTLIKVKVAVPADASTGTKGTAAVGGGDVYYGASKIYNVFVAQMFNDADELEIHLGEGTDEVVVTKDNATEEEDSTPDARKYTFEYGVDKNDPDTVRMLVDILTKNTLQTPNVTYQTTGTVDAAGDDVPVSETALTFADADKITGGYRSGSVDVDINSYDAATQEPEDVDATILTVTATSESGTTVQYTIKLYRKSSDASLAELYIPGSDKTVGEVDITNGAYYSAENATHYTISRLSSKFVDEDATPNTIPVYIKATSKKAVITVTDVNGNFIYETTANDDDNNTTDYIKVPITLTNSKTQVKFRVTAEDGSAYTDHVVDITVVSSNAELETIMYAPQFGSRNATAVLDENGNAATVERDGRTYRIYKGFLSTDDVNLHDSEVTVAVASKSYSTKLEIEKVFTHVHADTTQADTEYIVGDYNTGGAQWQQGTITGFVSYLYKNYLADDRRNPNPSSSAKGLPSLAEDDDEYLYMHIHAVAEDGITEEYYELRLFAMDTQNTNLEHGKYPKKDDPTVMDENLFSLWVGEIGAMPERPNTRLMEESELRNLYANTSIPTFLAKIGENVSTIRVRGITEYEYSYIKIEDSKYTVHDLTETITGLRPKQARTIGIYVRSQNQASISNSSSAGAGTYYRLRIERVSEDRRLASVEIAPEEMKTVRPQADYPYDEDEYQFIQDRNDIGEAVPMDGEVIEATVNYGVNVVPVKLTSYIPDALITVTGSVLGGTAVESDDLDETRTYVTGEDGTVTAFLEFPYGDDDSGEQDTMSYTITVENIEGDLNPRIYTLILKRKINNLALDEVYVNDNIAALQTDENGELYYYAEIPYGATEIPIYAIAQDHSKYVDVDKNADTQVPYNFNLMESTNPAFQTASVITEGKSYDYTTYVGSSHMIGGLPDQIKSYKLRIKRLNRDDILSDLQVIMRAYHLPNNPGVEATFTNDYGSTGVATYEVLVNQNAVEAWVNVTNNYSTTKLTAYYPIEYVADNNGAYIKSDYTKPDDDLTNYIRWTDTTDLINDNGSLKQRYALTEDAATYLGSDNKRLTFSVPMDSDMITVRVRAQDQNGTGAIKEYNLNIRRESNDATLEYAKMVYVHAYNQENPNVYMDDMIANPYAISNGIKYVNGATMTGTAAMRTEDGEYVVNAQFNTYVMNMPENSGTSRFELKATSQYATIELYNNETGLFMPYTTDPKYLRTTNSLTVTNVKEQYIYFRIVPASIAFNANSPKTQYYNALDGCTYYRLDIINTPVGTGIKQILTQYESDGTGDHGFEASRNGNFGFIATVSDQVETMDIKITPVLSDATIIIDSYPTKEGVTPTPTGTQPNSVVIRNVYLENEVTDIPIKVQSVAGITSDAIIVDYTLRIIKVSADAISMIVTVQDSIDAPLVTSETDANYGRYVAETELPSYLQESKVSVQFLSRL
ncbi:MAG: hypothetical protein IJI48_06395, partial [Ruminococcus sp.]|nr:hypothetical protein [Ruminococcus sp.]